MSHGLVSKALVSELFLVVALTMALTPFLAELGARLGKAFESSDFKVQAPAFLCAPSYRGTALCKTVGAMLAWWGSVPPQWQLWRPIPCAGCMEAVENAALLVDWALLPCWVC